MRHLKALCDAGLTDVHLLRCCSDLATVPEAGCVNIRYGGAADKPSGAAGGGECAARRRLLQLGL